VDSTPGTRDQVASRLRRWTESPGRARGNMLFLPVRLLTLRSLLASCSSTWRTACCLGRALSALRRWKCRRLLGWLSGPLARPRRCGASSHSQRSEEALRRPFDPPRRLVIRGPYRFVRIRCTSAQDSPSPAPRSSTNRFPLLGYARLFFLVTYVFVVATRSPLYGEHSGQSTKHTAAKSGDGGGGRRRA